MYENIKGKVLISRVKGSGNSYLYFKEYGAIEYNRLIVVNTVALI